MINIYGTIGYTILQNNKYNKKIIIMADMHDTLPSCSKKEINISDWFKSKFNTSGILLEEVPRDNVVLEELWGQSKHTQQLKRLYLNNPKIIDPVDIRPLLIPFSWELINQVPENNMKFKRYLLYIDNFFSLKNSYLKKKLVNYNVDHLVNSNLGKHFLKIKKIYYKFLLSNYGYLKKDIKYIYQNKVHILNDFNDILNHIMEWFICAKININKKKSIILHTGLAHSEKVIQLLIKYYNYNIIMKNGVNTLEESDSSQISGCIELSPQFDQLFG